MAWPGGARPHTGGVSERAQRWKSVGAMHIAARNGRTGKDRARAGFAGRGVTWEASTEDYVAGGGARDGQARSGGTRNARADDGDVVESNLKVLLPL